MAKQVDTNCSASNGLAPLHLAAIANHLETAAALIEGKADPNQQTAQGFSALMIAAFLGIEEFVKLLLEKGADPELKDRNGISASQFALSQRNDKIVNLLQEKSSKGTIDTILSSNSSPPILMRRIEPIYLEEVRLARIQGRVLLQATIYEEGSVESVAVLQSAHPLLDEAVVSAVKQWKYRPALQDGQPFKTSVTITINFVLQ